MRSFTESMRHQVWQSGHSVWFSAHAASYSVRGCARIKAGNPGSIDCGPALSLLRIASPEACPHWSGEDVVWYLAHVHNYDVGRRESVAEDTPLTKAIRGEPESTAGEKTTDLDYDGAAKIVLSDRRIIPAYRELSIDKILKLIGGDIVRTG